MQEPEPFPGIERVAGEGPRGEAATGAGSGWLVGDSPTVRTGSSNRGAGTVGDGPASPLPRPGDRIESFELEEAIGVGGMGAVFRVLDLRLDRQVALKILPPEQAGDSEVVQRFYQEGRAAARLDHENIARVYTIGHDARFHYIAFEYIEGTTIRQRVERNGPLPVSEAINYTLQIAGALVHAAERGVVHRDIKPSNIIVTPQGRAKLVDMGLARRFERGGDDGLTQSGMTLGTFDYISPEQARDPRDVDVRSDLYSLGCTLFHMLTGRPPFPEGTVLQKLLQHQEDAPPDVLALNQEVPPDLASILVKLMAKDRDRRYQTPEQLVRDLLTVAGALGLRSVSPEGLVWMSASRAPGWERHLVWGLPSVALATVILALVWWGQDAGGPPSRPIVDGLAKTTIRPPEPARPNSAPATSETPPAADRAEGSAQEPNEKAPAAPREIAVDSSEDLLDILANARPGTTVLLADDGPYELGAGATPLAGNRFQLRDVTIKADAGVRPIVRLSREADSDGKGTSALFDFRGGRVVLEGLGFVVEAGGRNDPLAAIRAEDTELTVRRCLFRRPGARRRRGPAAAIAIRMSATTERPPSVIVDACHFDGGQAGIHLSGPADLTLLDCTLAGAEPAVWCDNAKAPNVVPAELRFRHDSVVASADGPVFRFEGTAPHVRIDDSVISPARDAEATLVAIDDPDILDWRGRGNLYSRIGTYLQSTSPRPGREPIRDWTAWEEGLGQIREAGSIVSGAKVWDESDPLQVLAQGTPDPTRVFRLSPTHPGPLAPGVRQGPFGILGPSLQVAANLVAPGRDPSSLPPEGPPPTPAAPRVPSTPPPTAPSPMPSPMPIPAPEPPESQDKPESDLAGMPVMPPMEREGPPPRANTPAESRTNEPKPTNVVAVPAAVAVAEADPVVLRSADRFLNAINQPDSRGGTLRLASDVDWDLAGSSIRGNARWVLRAEPGPTRPRIRFRPAPANPKTPTAWSVLLDLRSGALQLEGIDIVLGESDAPRQGRWAAFGVWGGADLGLTNCTVTVEGEQAISAAVVVPPSEPEAERGVEDPETSAAVVRLTNCLVRSGGDLVELAAGRRLDLDLSNALLVAEGSLVHAHGLPRGQQVEPISLSLSQVTARAAGGLVQLESALGEPELPAADVRVRDSILATTPQGAPLFRVDGQDGLAALRDRIRWEGHRVAYHQINAYRRDQSALVGAVPNIYDRPSWMVAVGTKEADPVHGDVKFLKEWDASRRAWTVRRDDARLAPDSPASQIGADLKQIPDPPQESRNDAGN